MRVHATMALLLVLLPLVPRMVTALEGQYEFTSSGGAVCLLEYATTDVWLTSRPNAVSFVFRYEQGNSSVRGIRPLTLTVRLEISDGRPAYQTAFYRSNSTLMSGESWRPTVEFFFAETDLGMSSRVNTTASLELSLLFKEYSADGATSGEWDNSDGEMLLPQVRVESPSTTTSIIPQGGGSGLSMGVIIASWVVAGVAVVTILVFAKRHQRLQSQRYMRRR